MAGALFASMAAGSACAIQVAHSPLSSSSFSGQRLPAHGLKQAMPAQRLNERLRVSAMAEEAEKAEAEKPDRKDDKQSLFGQITDALDFAQVRSEEDAELLWEARQATKAGGKMTREQYAALRRKVGGTAQSYFKEFIDVDGQYTDEGWVDKTCWICKKDTSGEPRTVDGRGRYAHQACSEARAQSGNIFTRLFRR